MIILTPADERLAFVAPQPVDRQRAEARLDRFPAHISALLAGQLGPLANLRSSSGCALLLRTDAPWIEVRLDRLRHHVSTPQALAIEIVHDHGRIDHATSSDLREHDGALAVRLQTGCERGGPLATLHLWLPTISTCAVAGVALPDGCQLTQVQPPRARWLALGDSLTQGFTVADPTQTWVHRLARQLDLPAWNLGVGGLLIEPDVVAWALADRSWDLVTIALGANHAWRDSDAARAADAADRLATLALAGGHQRVIWILPPWKPCEAGLGPPEFMGVPLDTAAGARGRQVREALRERLAGFAPRLQVIENPAPRDHRYYLDGLHPSAAGFAKIATGISSQMLL